MTATHLIAACATSAQATAPTKHHDWQLRLESFVQARQNQPFGWGTNDCCTFAADAVQAMCGVPIAPAPRGQYQGVRQALRTQRQIGGVVALATSVLGQPIAPLLARPGDVVAIMVGGRAALAICTGATAFGPTRRGIAHAPMASATHAWRLG